MTPARPTAEATRAASPPPAPISEPIPTQTVKSGTCPIPNSEQSNASEPSSGQSPDLPASQMPVEQEPLQFHQAPSERPPLEKRQPGKGGKNHRYLQSLAKQLAEQQGLRATIEAPLPSGAGQVDVLIERDGVLAAIEISVSTPIEYEKLNLRKCLDAGYPRVGVVLAKSKRTQGSYQAGLSEGLTS